MGPLDTRYPTLGLVGSSQLSFCSELILVGHSPGSTTLTYDRRALLSLLSEELRRDLNHLNSYTGS